MNRLAVDIFFLLCFIILQSNSHLLGDEAEMTVPQLIRAAGYPVESHQISTLDGYILQMHRIPAGRRTDRWTGRWTSRRSAVGGKGKRAVFLQHGLAGSSDNFIIMGPGKSLAYLLAGAGYDVWMGNFRGNVYTTHRSLTRNDPAFWEYSFHEHGKYDLPAMIDQVLNVTRLQKILYIGHSMGTTSFFTMMSQHPEYNDKIVAFIALAPAVYMDDSKVLAEFLLMDVDLPGIMREVGMLSATPHPELLELISGRVCNAKTILGAICWSLVYAFVGEDFNQNDWKVSPIAMARMQPASWRQLEHYGKIAITGVFTSWEGGLYGAVKPYNLSNVKIPVSLLYGENDQLTRKRETMRLARELKMTGALEEVRQATTWSKFNHLDFIFARDVGTMLNEPLVEYVHYLYSKYTKGNKRPETQVKPNSRKFPICNECIMKNLWNKFFD